MAETKQVECKFLLNIPTLDFLIPGTDEGITQGKDLSLPFWMAKTLYTYSMIDIKLPNNYNKKFREVLECEAEVSDLHKAGPDYYKFGKLLIELKREKGNNLEIYTEEGQRNKYRREEGETLEDRKMMAESLMKTFHRRRHKLLDYSLNYSNTDIHAKKEFETRLDNMEKRLYSLCKQQLNSIISWESEKRSKKKRLKC